MAITFIVKRDGDINQWILCQLHWKGADRIRNQFEKL